jgi:hypothetical protein
MAGEEDTDIRWVERDSREWVLFAHQPDQLTARMTCTYLETGGVEARVGSQGGNYCVEVPATQIDRAFAVYQPADSNITPPMDEQSRKTGVHTGKHLRESILKQARKQERKRRNPALLWLLRVLVIGALVALLLLIFQG